MSDAKPASSNTLPNGALPDVNLPLIRRIEAVAAGRNVTERRAAARRLLRDLEQVIRSHPGPCPMQHYCLASCAMARQLEEK